MPRCQPSVAIPVDLVTSEQDEGGGEGGTCNLRLWGKGRAGQQRQKGGGGEHESLMIEALVSQAWPLDY